MKTTLKKADYRLMAEQAVNDAIKQIQDKLGETDGGYAGFWFSDKASEMESFTDLLTSYAEFQDKLTNK